MSNAIAKSVGFSEILVATDFSRQADYALEVAKSIARESKGELLLVHVSQPASHIALPEGGWLDVSSLLQQAEDATETAGAVLREEGFRAKALCCYGGVTSEIVREAKENLVDLVVTGTEGKQGLAHFFLGSHAESLAGELTIPSLIIGPRSNIPKQNEWWPSRVVCVAPTTMRGAETVAFACRLACGHGSTLAVAQLERRVKKIITKTGMILSRPSSCWRKLFARAIWQSTKLSWKKHHRTPSSTLQLSETRTCSS